MPPSRVSACVLLLVGLLACSEEEEEKDPRPILDACNLPTPCGRIGDLEIQRPPGPVEPLTANACIHDVLASSEPAHVSGYWNDVWSGVVYWDLYLGTGRDGVMTHVACGAPHDCEDCESTCSYEVERCLLQSIDRLECAECGYEGCPMGFVPSDFVCGAPGAWCSARYRAPVELACP